MAKTKAAGIFLVNKKKEVLICHPTNHPMTLWSIPKGKIEFNENPVDAAIRETYEETNINLSSVNSLIPLEELTYRHKKKSLKPYLVLETRNPSINFDSFDLKCNSNVPEEQGGFPEMDDYQWVSLDEARKLLHYLQADCIDSIEKYL
jgi:8-oxo-dGTP pyrophosphatase MutT (NUDIX family)